MSGQPEDGLRLVDDLDRFLGVDEQILEAFGDARLDLAPVDEEEVRPIGDVVIFVVAVVLK